jgi:hypothetical protein
MTKAITKSPKKPSSTKYQDKVTDLPNVLTGNKQNKKGKDQKLRDKIIKE